MPRTLKKGHRFSSSVRYYTRRKSFSVYNNFLGSSPLMTHYLCHRDYSWRTYDYLEVYTVDDKIAAVNLSGPATRYFLSSPLPVLCYIGTQYERTELRWEVSFVDDTRPELLEVKVPYRPNPPRISGSRPVLLAPPEQLASLTEFFWRKKEYGSR